MKTPAKVKPPRFLIVRDGHPKFCGTLYGIGFVDGIAETSDGTAAALFRKPGFKVTDRQTEVTR